MQRLVSYNYNGQRQWGVLASDGVSIYSAEDLEETYFIPLGETMEEFIESGEEGLLNLARALEMNAKDKSIEPLSLKDVRLEVPFYPRRNILCVGKNYQAHVKEFDQNANAKNPAVPIFFTKATTSVIGPDEEIDSHPAATKEVDYEGELGVIIGKRCTNVAAEDAMKYVYGYTIINDVTARDLQRKHVQWFKGKSLDTFCPMGPTVMVGDWPVPFTIYTKVNGHLRQEGSTNDASSRRCDCHRYAPGSRYGTESAAVPEKGRCGGNHHRSHRHPEEYSEIRIVKRPDARSFLMRFYRWK